MKTNDVGRLIPEQAGSYCNLEPYQATRDSKPNQKVIANLEEAVEKVNLQAGMTISFHHHFRDGDVLLNRVMNIIAEKGIKDLTLVTTSLRKKHAELIEHIKEGIITNIYTSGLRGELGAEICEGLMEEPVRIYSHGGRAGAIETGRIEIDVAFIAAASADKCGNLTGAAGKSPCGSLGYAKVDAQHAENVVGVTDNLVEFPPEVISIAQDDVDWVVEIESIGNPEKIATGSLREVNDPKKLQIARKAGEIISELDYFRDGFSLQTGAGGISLAILSFLEEALNNQDIYGSFLLGGISGAHVELMEKGFFTDVFDTQTFGLGAIDSLRENKNHREISGALYASPFNKGALVNQLDVAVLSALEVDTNFNVNVITGSDGYFRGASGGHSDVAAGAEVTIVVLPSIRGRIPTIKEEVTTVVTPGQDVDIVVTERGVCVNPESEKLQANLQEIEGIEILDIKDLKDQVEGLTGKPNPPEFKERVVGLIEYRDGTIIDVVREIKR